MTATTAAVDETSQPAVDQSQERPKHILRTLGRSLREYKTSSLLAPAFVLVEGILEIAIPTVMATLIDEGITGGNMPAILKFGLILLLCALVSLVCGFLAGKYAAIAAAGFAKNLRHDLFAQVQGFSFTNIDRFSTGSIITRLTTDVTNLQNAYMMIVRTAVRAPVMMIVSWVFAFRISKEISLVFLVIIPILAVVLIGLAAYVHPIFERVFHTYDELNNVVDENLQGIRVVKSFNREEHEDRKFGGISETIYNNFVRAEKILSFNAPAMNLCIYTALIVISWVGAQQIVASGNDPALGLTTGDMTALVTYALQILMSMMMISMIFVMVIISRASAERICQVLNEISTVRDHENPVTEVKDGSIEFDHVTFRYDLVTLRDQVAMVLQKNILFSGTIAENLRWGNPDATDEEIRHACQLAQADGFIQEFPKKYDTYIEQGGTNVSGGQRQRLCIARALLKKPKILILDDSTSAVDTKTDKLIREAFHHEIPDTTKIIIAQRVASVEESDLILVMNAGRIIARGTHEELLQTCDEYREIYESQTQNKAGEE